jgi:hypothetical protein
VLTIGENIMTAEAIILTDWGNKIHYRNRKPAWVKYPCGLLKDLPFRLASADARALYPLLLCMAATSDDNTTGVLKVRDIEKETKIPKEQLIANLDELCDCKLIKPHREELPNNGMPEGWGVPKVPTPEEKAEMDRLTKEAFDRMFASMEESRHYGKKK